MFDGQVACCLGWSVITESKITTLFHLHLHVYYGFSLGVSLLIHSYVSVLNKTALLMLSILSLLFCALHCTTPVACRRILYHVRNTAYFGDPHAEAWDIIHRNGSGMQVRMELWVLHFTRDIRAIVQHFLTVYHVVRLTKSSLMAASTRGLEIGILVLAWY